MFNAPTLPKTIVVPKVENRDEIVWFFDYVQDLVEDREDRMEDFSEVAIDVLTQVEGANGLMNLRDICLVDTEDSADQIGSMRHGVFPYTLPIVARHALMYFCSPGVFMVIAIDAL